MLKFILQLVEWVDSVMYLVMDVVCSGHLYFYFLDIDIFSTKKRSIEIIFNNKFFILKLLLFCSCDLAMKYFILKFSLIYNFGFVVKLEIINNDLNLS